MSTDSDQRIALHLTEDATVATDIIRQWREERERQRGWRLEWAGLRFHKDTTLEEVQAEVANEGCFVDPAPITYGPESA